MRKEILKHSFYPILYNQIGVSIAATVLLFALKDVISMLSLLIWAAFFFSVVLYRISTYLLYKKTAKSNDDEVISKNENNFIYGSFCIALIWGSLCVFLYPHDSSIHQSYLVITIIILISISTISLIPNIKSLYLISSLSIVPLIIQLFISDASLTNIFASILTLYLILLTKAGKKLHHTFIENIYYKHLSRKNEIISKDNENKYKIFYEKSGDAILIISDNKISMANPAAVKLFECDSLQLMLDANPFIFAPLNQPSGIKSTDKLKEIYTKISLIGKHRFNWTYRTQKGNERPAEISLSLISFENKQGIFCLVRDMSVAKKHEQELILAQKNASQANQAKSQFLANMSHEIRTPMNGVIGATNLLLQHELNQDQYLRALTIKSSASAMLSILNNILDFSKIEAGKVDLENIKFDITQLVQEISSSTLNSALEKGLNFTYSMPNITHKWHSGDSGRIQQILNNLLHNAIKFTNQGNIVLSCKTLTETNDESTIEFTIKDTGIGLSQQQQNLLFKPFVQGDNSTTRKYGGTGLGLSICSQLARLMNASLKVDSQVNKGSQFIFTIPLKKSEEKRSTVQILSKNSIKNSTFKAKVLVVDDMTINLEVTMGMLKYYGIDVVLAENGLEAINHLKNEHFDLILMDCQMPVMDGYKTTKAIRLSDPNVINTKIPIIAITANAMQGDRKVCIDAGMDDYLAKPFELDELETILNKWLASKNKR